MATQLVDLRGTLSWQDQLILLQLADAATDDDAFMVAAKGVVPAVVKVGPHGYSHGWVKVGSLSYHDVSADPDGRNKTNLVHRDSGTVLGSVKEKLGPDGKYSYHVQHADGAKLGKHTSLNAATRAMITHHNTVYSSFDRDSEPELAALHDSITGYQPRKVREADLVKVGPKGYIHGWIKVGPAGDTLSAHSDEHGNISPKRVALHDKIVNGTLEGHSAKDKPVATFLGGGPASGKSTVMKDTEGKLVIDADGMKAKLPEYQRMIKNGDKRAASIAHEESSHLANRAMNEAAARKLDFTLDGTGDSGIEKLAKKVQAARKNGHSIDAKYVTVDSDEAVKRAMKRAARTGRMVPESTIRATHAAVSRTFKAAIDRGLFDTAELWDNNGREPKLIGRKLADGPFQVHDREAWEKFLAKGQEET